MPIPVYVFTGFLDAGKTKFIQETLEDPRFNAGERTLLLAVEEGEVQYPNLASDSAATCCATVSYTHLTQPTILHV